MAVLNSERLIIPDVDIVPLHQPWAAKEQWKTWPLWQAHRIWSVARITAGAPIVSASEDFIAISFACPFHHHRTIGLQHMQKACPGTLDLRRNHPNSSIDPSFNCRKGLEKRPKGGFGLLVLFLVLTLLSCSNCIRYGCFLC